MPVLWQLSAAVITVSVTEVRKPQPEQPLLLRVRGRFAASSCGTLLLLELHEVPAGAQRREGCSRSRADKKERDMQTGGR